ncbi:hypothetical protein J1N35_017950 [Gossypium stocksii]|uniref:Uncharacterized protein n=1 Tax=Gossypium stocksii TaxID=47602 RepID=A0A9D3VPY1_9ROSI|nr:hypothetical protein J1N35_017950 [Gossypium stocksii]
MLGLEQWDLNWGRRMWWLRMLNSGIHFSDRVHNLIDGSMGNVEIVRLLGRSIGFKALMRLGAGTCPLGNYILLTLLPAPPNRYYTKSIFRAIANVIGKVIKIDYNTALGKRGHFAHLAVIVYLSKPLLSSLDKARANSSRFNILDAIDETDCEGLAPVSIWYHPSFQPSFSQ